MMSNFQKIMVLGITGMLGYPLFRKLSQNSYLMTYGTARNLYSFNNRNFQEISNRVYGDIHAENITVIENLIQKISPSVIINCIGIIKQMPAAKYPIPSITINALFPHQLAQLCQKYQAKLIHISTDCVFSGLKGNYTEQDNPDPIDLYGRTKLLGEVTDNNCLTLRTSIIGRELNSQNSLLEWFLSQQGKTVKGYDRAIYTGFTTPVLAQIIEKIILEHPTLTGLWHVSSNPVTKYQLLNIINQTFNLGITIEKDETFICDRSLNSDLFRHHTGFVPPSWETMITQIANTNHS